MKSIRNKLLLSQMISMGLIMTICMVIFYVYIHRTLHQQFDSYLSEKTSAFTQMGEIEDPQDEIDLEYDDNGDDVENYIKFEFAEIPLQEFQELPDPEYYQVWNKDGLTLARSPSLQTANLDYIWPNNTGLTIEKITLPDGRTGKAARARFIPNVDNPATQSSSNLPELILTIAKSTEDLDATLSTVFKGLLGSGLAGLAIMFMAIIVSVQKGLLPLEELRSTLEQLDSSTLDSPLSDTTLPAELIPVVDCLDDLLKRLDKSFQRERRFNADVAHELRTPISELLALAEVSANRDDIEEGHKHSYEDTKEIGKRMEKIVQSLLEISRCESTDFPVEATPTDIAALVNSNWEPFAQVAKEKGIEFSINVDHNESWDTDSVLLGTVLTNLFSNAVSYTPQGGHISVETDSYKGQLRLKVRNTTESLDAKDIDHIFDTFWRKDTARSDSIHLGLGLALVKALSGTLGLHLVASMVEANTFELHLSRLSTSS